MKRILIVDNDETILEALAVRLEDLGHECVHALSGSEALACFQEQPTDLVITDLNMPGCDGIALAESLRESSSVPIIIMTAFPTTYEGSWDHLQGVMALTKPFAWNTMLHLVESELRVAG